MPSSRVTSTNCSRDGHDRVFVLDHVHAADQDERAVVGEGDAVFETLRGH